MQLRDSVFLIMGGGFGLGVVVVWMVVKVGVQVVILDINVEVGQVVVDELGVCFICIDVISVVEGQVVICVMLQVFGCIDVVVNCVGVVLGECIVGCDGLYDLESFVCVVQINLIGSFNMLCFVVEVMICNDGLVWGVIVNMVLIVVYDGQIG